MMQQGELLRFFIVGDIGEEGEGRRAVARAMAALQQTYSSSSAAATATATSTPCSFVLTTGDNIYDKRATESSFSSLVSDMVSKVQMPWFACLGNHDVKNPAYEWHLRHNGVTSADGWSWNCPAPSYSINDASPGITKGLVDIFVINTSKMKSGWFGRGGAPPGHSEGFYSSNDRHWWKEQKESLEKMLKRSKVENRWRIVLGHHPAEYIYSSYLEQRMPIVRYFKATFMKGGWESKRNRWSLSHILRRDSDFYICGHQHLMAHMKLQTKPPKRNVDETHCNFVILGCSSTLDNDENEFDDDMDSALPTEEIANTSYMPNKDIGKEGGGVITTSASAEAVELFPSSQVIGNNNLVVASSCIAASEEDGGATLSTATNNVSKSLNRYQTEWMRPGCYGFATVLVSKESCVLTFFAVNIETGEYSKVYEVPLSK